MKKAFSLAEIMIAATFMGVLAILTIPDMMNSKIVNERSVAYNTAYEIVNKALIEADNYFDKSDAGVSRGIIAPQPPTDVSILPPKPAEIKRNTHNAQVLWQILSTKLPVSSYSVGSTNAYPSIEWCENGTSGCVTAGTPSADTHKYKSKTVSPWINTSNGLSFSVRYVDTKSINCSDTATLGFLHKKDDKNVRDALRKNSCMYVLIDVNGLDTNPNQTLDAKGLNGEGDGIIEESRFRDLARFADTYDIWIGSNKQISFGAYSNADNKGMVEYFLTKAKSTH